MQAFELNEAAALNTFFKNLNFGGKQFQIFNDSDLSLIIMQIQKLISSSKEVNSKLLKSLPENQQSTMSKLNQKGISLEPKNSLVFLTLSQLLTHKITKSLFS